MLQAYDKEGRKIPFAIDEGDYVLDDEKPVSQTKRSVNVNQPVSPIFGGNYKLSDIIGLAELLEEINSTPLEQLRVFDDSGKQMIWDEEILKQWKFTGLNNFDFIRTEFYKNGFM